MATPLESVTRRDAILKLQQRLLMEGCDRFFRDRMRTPPPSCPHLQLWNFSVIFWIFRKLNRNGPVGLPLRVSDTLVLPQGGNARRTERVEDICSVLHWRDNVRACPIALIALPA